jgi:hypothetical protein
MCQLPPEIRSLLIVKKDIGCPHEEGIDEPQGAILFGSGIDFETWVSVITGAGHGSHAF